MNTIVTTRLFKVFLLFIFLLPIFIIPQSSFFVAKGVYSLLGGGILASLWLFEKWKKPVFEIPKNISFWLLWIIPVFAAFASLVQKTGTLGFFGQSFEPGTVIALFLGACIASVTLALLKTRQNIATLYFVVLGSSLAIALFQLVKILLGTHMPTFGILSGNAANLLGKINEFSIFFGLATIISMLVFSLLPLRKGQKILTSIFLGVSLIFLAWANFAYVTIAVGVFAIVSAVITYMKTKKISYPSLTVVVVSILIFFFGATVFGYLGTKVSDRFIVSQVEISPTMLQTLSIGWNVAKSHPLTGAGANSFTNAWLMHKPDSINLDPLWYLDFGFGKGLIPTYLTTFGPIGFLLAILLLVSLALLAIKALRLKELDATARFMVLASVVTAVYLWLFHVIYVPTHVLFILTFVFTGVLFATLKQHNLLSIKTIDLTGAPSGEGVAKKYWPIGLVGCVVLILTLLITWAGISRVSASYYYQAALAQTPNTEGVVKAETYLRKAIAKYPSDDYFRALTQIDLAKISTLVETATAQKKKNEEIVPIIKPIVDDAVLNANSAIFQNPKNYLNYLNIAQVYSLALSPENKEAYAQTLDAYQKALAINPKNPSIVFSIAQLDASMGDAAKTKANIIEAIRLKPNYSEAVYALYQIQASENDSNGMLNSLVALALINPGDPTIHFQLGYLLYTLKDDKNASRAFSEAIKIDPSYSNARYFLAILLARNGSKEEALNQLSIIKSLNPDNKEIDSMIANIKAGHDPLNKVKEPAKPPVQTPKAPVKKRK